MACEAKKTGTAAILQRSAPHPIDLCNMNLRNLVFIGLASSSFTRFLMAPDISVGTTSERLRQIQNTVKRVLDPAPLSRTPYSQHGGSLLWADTRPSGTFHHSGTRGASHRTYALPSAACVADRTAVKSQEDESRMETRKPHTEFEITNSRPSVKAGPPHLVPSTGRRRPKPPNLPLHRTSVFRPFRERSESVRMCGGQTWPEYCPATADVPHIFDRLKILPVATSARCGGEIGFGISREF
jgi:hypothetical protein